MTGVRQKALQKLGAATFLSPQTQRQKRTFYNSGIGALWQVLREPLTRVVQSIGERELIH